MMLEQVNFLTLIDAGLQYLEKILVLFQELLVMFVPVQRKTTNKQKTKNTEQKTNKQNNLTIS